MHLCARGVDASVPNASPEPILYPSYFINKEVISGLCASARVATPPHRAERRNPRRGAATREAVDHVHTSLAAAQPASQPAITAVARSRPFGC